jgi:signal transduction histidine kinase
VFRIGDVLEAAVGTLEPAGVDIELMDITEPLRQRILARHWSSTRGPEESPVSPSGTGYLQRQLNFAVAGRTWRVTATAAPAFLRAHQSMLPVWIVAPGLLVTGLVTGCVIMLIGRTARVEGIVSSHTQKLTAINEQQERTNLELQHRNQEILRLCYAMTHDLQTPLASLAGGVDALEHRLDGASPDQMKWMDRIRKSAQRMVGMLDDLMVYARMGTEEIESEPVNLGERIRVAIDELQAQAAQKGVRIDFRDDAGRRCTVMGDRKIIVRVLLNLVGNAIKYVESDADGTVKITMSSRGAFVRIGIRDSGPGIEPALLDEVFEPFRRASPGTSGTGLGLSIVRRYVTTMGGRVWLESDGRNGTTAVVELPSTTAARGYLAA